MVLKRLSGRHSKNRKPRRLIDGLFPGLPFTSSACGHSSGKGARKALPKLIVPAPTL